VYGFVAQRYNQSVATITTAPYLVGSLDGSKLETLLRKVKSNIADELKVQNTTLVTQIKTNYALIKKVHQAMFGLVDDDVVRAMCVVLDADVDRLVEEAKGLNDADMDFTKSDKASEDLREALRHLEAAWVLHKATDNTYMADFFDRKVADYYWGET
jgi:hypothetical protein